jgi:hypothetical protein
MKKVYEYYDTDIDGNEEYDIADEQYKNLISICGNYCTTLSLVITNHNSNLLNEISKYEIPKSEKITFQYTHYKNTDIVVKYYRVCEKLIDCILSNTNSIFCWINGWGYSNPEDPTFYREDGSVFFSSTIHDGICRLIVDESQEDVSNVISNHHWINLNSCEI